MSLRIDLRPSRFLALLLLGQFFLGISAVFLLATEALFALLLLLPIGAGAHFLRRRPVSPRALVLMADKWHLVYEERVECAVLKDEFFCTSWLQVLEFQVQEGTSRADRGIFVTIFPDSASAAERRQLCSVLRWYHFPRCFAAEQESF